MKSKKISAVVPFYKDEKSIPYMYERLVKVFRKINIDYEIIFVNDASPDHSDEVLQKIAKKDKRVTVIVHSRNFGSQMCFTHGMDLCTGDAVVLLDGDLQDPPEIIEKFYRKWTEGYEVVYGVRTRRKAPVAMQMFYKLFYRIFKALAYIQIPLDAGDFSLIDRKVIEAMKLFPERDRFLRGLRAWVGFKQIGIPYVRPERMFGKSTNNLLKNIGWATKGIFSFSYAPLEAMTIASFILFLFTTLILVIDVMLKIVFPDIAPKGTTTIIIAILFIGATQMLSISIIGQYVGKIFEEVKMRPKYITKKIINKPKK